MVRQQPRLDGTNGQPETERWRRIGRKRPDNRAGAGLRVEITKNEHTAPMRRGDDKTR